MSRIRLTVIVATTGRRLSLQDSLRSIRLSLDTLTEMAELLVVHNAKEPSSEIHSLCKALDARYVHEPVVGLSIARNRGVIEAKGELVAFVDDDTNVFPDWACSLVQHFRVANVEAVTGRVLTTTRGDRAGVMWESIYGAQPSETTIFPRADDIPFLAARHCGLGNNMAFRTAFLLKYGLFDPLFGLGGPLPGGEEVDRFYAVLKQGKRIMYAPDVRVEHAYPDDLHTLHGKIRGYAAAQMGFFLKCFWSDPPIRALVARYITARLATLLGTSELARGSPRKSAPRRDIILGSLRGPFSFLVSLAKESLWPRRVVILPPQQSATEAPGSPRLLIVFYNSGLTGGPKISRILARSLTSCFQVGAILSAPGATTEWLHAAGIRIGLVPREPLRATWRPLHHLKYLLKFPGTVGAYCRAIRLQRPDILHVDSLLNLTALLAGKLSGVRTLLHLQEVPTGVVGGALATVAGILADRVVAVSRAAADPLAGLVAQGKIAVVYNGTGIGESVVKYNPNGWVSFVGGLSEHKDPISFIRAAEKVYEREPKTKFMICGLTVPGRARFEAAFFKVLEMSHIPKGNLIFYRDVEDVEELVRESSIVVNCSRVPESFGLAIIEAMALGIPVVVPRSGAFPELLRNHDTGLLYSPGNLDELAGCILRLLNDPHLAERVGLAGHALVRSKFREEQMVSAMADQYRQLLTRS